MTWCFISLQPTGRKTLTLFNSISVCLEGRGLVCMSVGVTSGRSLRVCVCVGMQSVLCVGVCGCVYVGVCAKKIYLYKEINQHYYINLPQAIESKHYIHSTHARTHSYTLTQNQCTSSHTLIVRETQPHAAMSHDNAQFDSILPDSLKCQPQVSVQVCRWMCVCVCLSVCVCVDM